MSDATKRTHIYSAEAKVLSGHLKLPISQRIDPQAHSHLAPEGGYFTQRSKGFTLESVISFRSGYTHVAGNRSLKDCQGWDTLTTTVVEGLNVLEVVTADRVVGQMITSHPLEGYVPWVSFLGTHFENLRIQGQPIEFDMDHNIIGPKPGNDAPYNKDEGFMRRVNAQYDRIRKHKELPLALQERYNYLSSNLGASDTVECSLVNEAAGRVPGRIFGNVITIPGFGVITLGRVTVKHEDLDVKTKVPKKTTVHLTMIDLKLGCPIQGSGSFGDGSSNGTSEP